MKDLTPGTKFTIDDESTVGFTFTVRSVIEGSVMQILSCDAVEKRGRQTLPTTWGFPDVAIDAWQAKGKVRISR